MPLPSPAQQVEARRTLHQLMSEKRTLWAVHYACESLTRPDRPPRIGAIVVRNVGTAASHVFSVSLVTDLNNLAPEDLPHNSDRVERRVLAGFFDHVRAHPDAQYLHWNMGSQQFGFAALEHRYIALGGTPTVVAVRDRHDLATLLVRAYGENVVKATSKLPTLAKLNGLKPANFLSGAEEAAAMADGRYRDIAASTEAKARAIAELALRAHHATLKTEAGIIANHGGPLRLLAQKVIENPLVTGVATLVGVGIACVKFWPVLFGG